MKKILLLIILCSSTAFAQQEGGAYGNLIYGEQGIGIGFESFLYNVSLSFSVLPTQQKPDKTNDIKPDSNFSVYSFSRMVYQIGVGYGYDINDIIRIKAHVWAYIEPEKRYLKSNDSKLYYSKPVDLTRAGVSYGGGFLIYPYGNLILGLEYDTKSGIIFNYGFRF